MSDESEKKVSGERSTWAGVATIAGAAIGSAALAAAVIFASRRKAKPTDAPAHPEDAPETD
jgi:Na+/H+-translocating membrane pyrophosphatase